LTALVGFGCWVLGIAATLSFNVWSDVRPLAAIPYLADKNIFGLLDFSIANFLLPLNAMLISVFAGWILSRDSLLSDLGIRNGTAALLLQITLRFVAPALIGAIFYTSLT
jgi:NSS family neurotransmitter:Na+ symporter